MRDDYFMALFPVRHMMQSSECVRKSYRGSRQQGLTAGEVQGGEGWEAPHRTESERSTAGELKLLQLGKPSGALHHTTAHAIANTL